MYIYIQIQRGFKKPFEKRKKTQRSFKALRRPLVTREHTKSKSRINKKSKTLEYKDVTRAKDYANMKGTQKTATNWAASTSTPLHGRPFAAQRGRPRLQQFSTKLTTTATFICPRFCPAGKRVKKRAKHN